MFQVFVLKIRIEILFEQWREHSYEQVKSIKILSKLFKYRLLVRMSHNSVKHD